MLPRQFKGLPKIWNSCIDDLSGYSRARARVKSLGSELSAWNALPSELRNKSLNPINEAFKTLVAAAPLEDAYRIVEVGEIAHLIGLAEALKLTPAQIAKSRLHFAELDGVWLRIFRSWAHRCHGDKK